MRLFLILLVSFFVTSVNAQINNKKETEPTFANQGEQEDSWAKSLFQNEYKFQNFERFKGKITLSADSINFDNKAIHIFHRDSVLRTIFEKGILYPEIIANYGQTHAGKVVKQLYKNPTKSSSLQTRESILAKLDAYSISNLTEVKFLSKSPHIKRFQFWLFNKLVSNPEVCFIELTNNAANEKTDLATFINGCNLTFFAHGWIII